MTRRQRPEPRLFVMVIALVGMTVAGVACGGGSSANSSTNAPGTAVSVSEKEFVITVNGTDLQNGNGNASIPVGMVTFKINNTGEVTHGLEIQGHGIDEKTGNIDPGGMLNLTLKLTAGTYEVFCPIPGHKQAGMDGHVTAK